MRMRNAQRKCWVLLGTVFVLIVGLSAAQPAIAEELVVLGDGCEAANPVESDSLEGLEIVEESAAQGDEAPLVQTQAQDGFDDDVPDTATSIEEAEITIDGPCAYTGRAVEPPVVVTLSGEELVDGTDYEVAYSNNVKAGTATATITGKGVYTGAVKKAFRIVSPSVSYRTHVQRVGWQSWKKNGKVAGTSGKSLRLDGVKVKLGTKPVSGSIRYRTYAQRVGWQGWKKNGAMSGTSGKALRLEAIRVKLTGKMAQLYDVWYRVHAQKQGWMGWAKNGASAGTEGYAYRLEALQIVIRPKGSGAPGATANSFRKRNPFASVLKKRSSEPTYSW